MGNGSTITARRAARDRSLCGAARLVQAKAVRAGDRIYAKGPAGIVATVRRFAAPEDGTDKDLNWGVGLGDVGGYGQLGWASGLTGWAHGGRRTAWSRPKLFA